MSVDDLQIGNATASDLDEILDLLRASSLPADGVGEHLPDFVVARDSTGRIVGCAAVERYGPLGLLRSVAVSAELQGSGLGSRLVGQVLDDARRAGVEEVVLLTTTARDFFARQFGFRETAREAYASQLDRSAEWQLPRCSSAVVMSLRLPTTDRKRVLILCTGNSARSQMAEGLLRHLAPDRFEVFSAGVSPTQVRAEAVTAMREIGIDISHQRSKSVDEFGGHEFDYVITVCDNANEQCPVFAGNTKRLHWSFDDPAAAEGDEELRLAEFRRVRDEILQQLRLFVKVD